MFVILGAVYFKKRSKYTLVSISNNAKLCLSIQSKVVHLNRLFNKA
jgi:hypothetical protein